MCVKKSYSLKDTQCIKTHPLADLKMQTQPPAGQTIPNGTPGKKKINYSSVTCGAKIIQANPESQNPSSILKENKDEYMNNPCTVKNGLVLYFYVFIASI